MKGLCEENNKPLLKSMKGLNKWDIDNNGFKSFRIWSAIIIDLCSMIPPNMIETAIARGGTLGHHNVFLHRTLKIKHVSL